MMNKQPNKQQPDVVAGDFVYIRGTAYTQKKQFIFKWWTPEKPYEVVAHPEIGLGVYADDGDFYRINGEDLDGNGHFEKVDIRDVPPQSSE